MRKTGRRSIGPIAEAGTGLLRATLLIGSLVGALALIVVPQVDRRSDQMVAERVGGLDEITTGSVSRGGGGVTRYTVHRSILDRPDRGPCIMFPDGREQGAC